MCSSFTEHSLIKFESMSVMYDSVINHGLLQLSDFDISALSPFISSLASVCSVNVSHMSDSVDAALMARKLLWGTNK